VYGECISYCEETDSCENGECVEFPDECDPVSDRGCPDYRHCGIYARVEGRYEWDCVPMPENPATAGEPCEIFVDPVYGSLDSCVGGSMCMLGSGGGPECLKLCLEDDSSFCDGVYPDGAGGFVDGICNLNVGLDDRLGILACLETSGCDPHCDNEAREGNPCGDDEMCLPAQDGGGNFGTICIAQARDSSLPGEGAAGDPCDYANSCLPGLMCVGDGTCHAFCDTSADPTAPPECGFSLCDAATGLRCLPFEGSEDTWATIALGVCGAGE
jgi:hypothetical protein